VKAGEFVRPVTVKVGASDGISTAIACESIHEGQEVVTGETAGTAQGGTRNPFLPQFRWR
jgi:hypothetical protein